MSTSYQEYSHESHRPDRNLDNSIFEPLHGQKRIKNAFIKKVYSILTVQLTITALWCILVFNSESLRNYVQTSYFLPPILGVAGAISLFALSASSRAASTVPYNFILLGLVTASYSFYASLMATHVGMEVVSQAAMATGAVFAGITWYASTNNGGFNVYPAMLKISYAILAVQLLGWIVLGTSTYNTVVSGLFAVSSAIGLLYETQKVLGKNENEYTMDDYIRASAGLFVEAISLFIELMKILNELQEKDDKKKKSKKDK